MGVVGVLTEYAHPIGQGWRAMQYLLFAMGVVASLACFFFLPETAHYRGIDSIREERAAALLLHGGSGEEEGGKEGGVRGWWKGYSKDWIIVWLNPLAPLKMLVHPHILAMVSPLLRSLILANSYLPSL
jgi:hypothetical protein